MSQHGTGGMKAKIDAVAFATGHGIPTIIAKGDEPNVLLRIVAGENVGTYFHPNKKNLRFSTIKIGGRSGKSR